MLKGMAGGIRFINGVPRRGGGIRTPKNGTWMLVGTEYELMRDAREVDIRRGERAVFLLPNKATVVIGAE
jgi:hypothetical protein